MILYEVNLVVVGTRAEEFRTWLDSHVREMLAFEGFDAVTWYEPEGEPPSDNESSDSIRWTVHYHVRDRSSLQNYFDTQADRMRQDGLDRFGEDFRATRRILKCLRKIS